MDEPSSPPEKPSNTPKSGGIDIQGGDVRAGRDIVAGNVNVAGDSIAGQTVIIQQGFSPAQVQRLVLIVAGVVAATAAIFFIIGAVSVGPVLEAINEPGQSSPIAAEEMRRKLAQIQELPQGQGFRAAFSQEEVSSYFRFITAPENNISDGKARFMDAPGQIAFGGNLENFWGLPMLAEVNVTTGADPVETTGVWVKVLPTGEGVRFGWIPVTFLAQNFTTQLNQTELDGVWLTRVATVAEPGQGVQQQEFLVVSGVAQ